MKKIYTSQKTGLLVILFALFGLYSFAQTAIYENYQGISDPVRAKASWIADHPNYSAPSSLMTRGASGSMEDVIVNDDCSGAILMTCGSTVYGSTVGAAFDADGGCSVIPGYAEGVWYKFVATGTQSTVTTCGPGSNYDTQLSVYSGSCGALVCESYNDDDFGCGSSIFFSTVTVATTPGTTYYVLVHGFVNNTGSFELTLNCGSNPCTPMTLTMGTKGVKNANFANHGAGDDNTYYRGISAAKGFDVCVSGGVAPYTAVWSSTAGSVNQFGNACGVADAKATVIYPGMPFMVSVTVTDANGCTETASMPISYVDYTCGVWDYVLCEVGTGITSCVATTNAASAALATGLYELGSCAPKTGFEADALSFAVYPSPTNGTATLRYNATKNASAQINVLDLNGRVIQSNSIELNQGNVEYGLDLSNVTNGVYFVQLVTENDVQTQKIQVLK